MPLTNKHVRPKLTAKQQEEAFVWWCNQNEEELNVYFNKNKITEQPQITAVAKGLWLDRLERVGLRSCNS